MSVAASLPVKRAPKRSRMKPPQMSINRNTLRKLYAPVKNPNSRLDHPRSLSSMVFSGATTSLTKYAAIIVKATTPNAVHRIAGESFSFL